MNSLIMHIYSQTFVYLIHKIHIDHKYPMCYSLFTMKGILEYYLQK